MRSAEALGYFRQPAGMEVRANSYRVDRLRYGNN
jgi:hypothetical protein